MIRRITLCSAALTLLIVVGACTPKPAEQPVGASSEPAETPGVSAPAPTPEPAASAAPAVTIYRDTWGVPHIYADTEADAAYGLGYAQAEDRLADLYFNVRTALGSLSEAFGKEHMDTDMAMHLVRNAETCKAGWETIPAELQAIAEQFVAGVNAYAADHPEKVPEWSVQLEPWHCLAIGRTMILKWPLGTIQDDLSNKQETPPMGSNQWAVAPSRSADGSAILLTDPHLGWEGMQVFYEARVLGGELEQNGFFLVGSPIMGFGHNANVGWAPTTGGPDTSDVYVVKFKQESFADAQYEFDGEWRKGKVRVMTIKVKDDKPVQRPTVDTHLGPVVDLDKEKGLAYIGASPYFETTDVFLQTYKMAKARNAQEFYDALGMNQMMEQNMMFADTEGNIQYVRTGATPIRPEGYNWNAPVIASSASMWTGIHPIEDLVQLKNPEQGYFQNCNISPANMMKNSPLTQDKYRDYIYNVSWDVNNPRGKRSTALLDADDSVTREEAAAYATDVHDILAQPWQTALKAAIDGKGAEKMKDPAFAQAVNDILAWDGEFTTESKATPVLKFWRLNCNKLIDVAAIAEGRPVPEEQQTLMLDLLGQTLSEMQEKYGSTSVAWGDIHVVGRGDKYFPVPGADFGASTDGPNFSETLFDVRSREDDEKPGRYIANNGTMALMLMFFNKDGVESYTCTPWGQSADPASAHYVDQAEKLYSKRQLKPSWWKKEDLLQNVKSEMTLTIPASGVPAT